MMNNGIMIIIMITVSLVIALILTKVKKITK